MTRLLGLATGAALTVAAITAWAITHWDDDRICWTDPDIGDTP